MATPHDTLFHFTFRHPRHAGPWLRLRLHPALAAQLDWTTLRLVSGKVHGLGLRVGITDIVYEIRFLGLPLRLLFVIEHRSHHDAGLHDTMVRYTVLVAHGARGDPEALPAFVIPIAFYHGRGPLVRGPVLGKPFADLDPAVADVLRALQPRLDFLGDDITVCSEAELIARNLTPLCTATHLALRYLPEFDAAETLAAIERWGPLLRAVDTDGGPPLGREAISKLGWYILHVNDTPAEDVHMAIEKHLQRPEETIMSTAEKLRREGRAEGHAEGHAEGRTATLVRLLNRRFGHLPEGTEDRLRAASAAELDRWTDRILDARTLADVFATD